MPETNMESARIWIRLFFWRFVAIDAYMATVFCNSFHAVISILVNIREFTGQNSQM